jgi:hypothetical protein
VHSGVWKSRCILRAVVLILPALGLLACGNEDLSELNDRYQAQQAAQFPTVQFAAELTPDQVVSEAPVMVDENVEAHAELTIDYYDDSITGYVKVTGLAPNNIGLYEGSAGLTSEEPVFWFEWDPENPDTWRIPANKKLSISQLERLDSAELYLQINTDNYYQGVLRTQVYFPCSEGYLPCVRVALAELSGEGLDSGEAHDTYGRAYVTIEEYGANIRFIRGVVRIVGLNPDSVWLVRNKNLNSPQGLVLEPEHGYWQFEEGTTLENSNFTAISGGNLFFVATYDDPSIGDITGKLSLVDSDL